MPSPRRIISATILVLLGVGIVVPLSAHLAPIAGRQVFAVRGSSMAPAIPIGSMIVVNEASSADVAAGDVVTWRSDNGVWVTHRVLQVVEQEGARFLQTQGDANESPDPNLVPDRAVVGIVEGWIPLAGYALTILSSPTGLVSWASFVLALFVADSLFVGPPVTRPSPRPNRLDALFDAVARRLRRGVGAAWPVHFQETTIWGDELELIEAMSRCAAGDHRACSTDLRPRGSETPVADRSGHAPA